MEIFACFKKEVDDGHCKKSLAVILSPAGMSLTKSTPLSLVSDILSAGDGKSVAFFTV
jgi:hypothetical protein